MSPTDEEIAQLLSRLGSRSASQRETIVGIEALLARAKAAETDGSGWRATAEKVMANFHSLVTMPDDFGEWRRRTATAESDLSTAREEIAELRKALKPFSKFDTAGFGEMIEAVPPDPTRADRRIEPMWVEDFRRAREALRSSRTKGDSRRVAVPASDIGADLATAADLPEHLRWKGDGPAPASWFAADGTKVYRSYGDYCDD